MKITDLKSPYRELAEMRHEQKPFEECVVAFESTGDMAYAFVFYYANEGESFWDGVNQGHYPHIPQTSLDELAEWQKGKEPVYEPTSIVESPDQRLFTAACYAMQGLLSNSAVGNQIGNQDHIAKIAVEQSQELLNELDKLKNKS